MSKIFGFNTSSFNPSFDHWKTTSLVVLVLILAGLPVWGGVATVLAQSADDGEAVFNSNGCSGCHSTGSNTLVGPGLAGIAETAASRTGLSADDYLRESLTDPGAFVVDGFAAIMPAFGDLSDADVSNLIAYLGTLSGAAAAVPISAAPDDSAPVADPVSALTGSASQGEDLFTGADRFEAKGPSCSACHSSSGLGALGGGTLGPDLTEAYSKFGDGLIVFPETSATMKPIFTERRLTDQEKADLLAFFRSADASERDTQQVIQLAGLALVGTAIIALFTHLIWRKRLQGVRKNLVGR